MSLFHKIVCVHRIESYDGIKKHAENDYFSFCENVYDHTHGICIHTLTKYQQYIYLDSRIIDHFYLLAFFCLFVFSHANMYYFPPFSSSLKKLFSSIGLSNNRHLTALNNI